MKKSFIYTYLDGHEEVVEYDDDIITEDGAREIYRNLDKFTSKRDPGEEEESCK